MKQELLENIIKKLETDKRDGISMFAVSVYDVSDPNNVFPIVINATNERLTADYGSATDFFKTLYKNGATKIRINGRKRNGTTIKRGNSIINWKESVIEPLEITMSANSTTEKSTEVTETFVPLMKTATPPIQSLGNPVQGLGLSENFKIVHYDILKHDYDKLAAKYEVAVEEIKRLDRKVFEQETIGVKTVEKSKAQAEMLNSPVVAQVAQILAAGFMGAQSQSQGLASPQSPAKQQLLQVDDAFANDLIIIANAMQNEEFDAKLTELLKEYKFLPNA